MAEIKGTCGYIKREKKRRAIKAGLFFAGIAVILITGYIITGTRLNWLTLIAVLLCLPGAKMLVQLITLMPHQSVSEARGKAVAESAAALTLVYETVITSTEKIMPVEITAIYDNTVCGYSGSTKVSVAEAGKYLKLMFQQNRLNDVTVKIYDSYEAFFARIKEMNQLAVKNKNYSKEKEEHIKRILLNLSM